MALGEKKVETRSWRTPYRGPLAIHAAKGYPGWAKDIASYNPMFSSVLGARGVVRLPRGGVVAVGRLVDVCGTEQINLIIGRKERAFGDYTSGRYAWIFADVLALPEPIPARGALGLWEWYDPDTFRWLAEQSWLPIGGSEWLRPRPASTAGQSSS
jgi:hypothetical protein